MPLRKLHRLLMRGIMTSRALAGANPRKDTREAQFDGLVCGELLHAGGA